MFIFLSYKFSLHLIYPIKYENIISNASLKYNVNKELILAIIKCESGFDSEAHSKADAYGLMQIIPETFEWLQTCYTHEKNMNESSLLIPEININYGTLLLSILLKQYSNEDAVLSAYNAGISATNKWLSNKNYSKNGKTLDYIPYKETRNYIKKVKKAKNIYKKLYFKS